MVNHIRVLVCCVNQIFDMNWHLKTTGWTGYTWDTKMYPNHTDLLDWLHGQDIFTAANLHDASCHDTGVVSDDRREEHFTYLTQLLQNVF